MPQNDNIKENIFPVDEKLQVSRDEKQKLLKQKSAVFWLYGLSGSGKSTLATASARSLHNENRYCVVLDGDNVRVGLNKDLGFSDSDRNENIRRIAEVAKLFAQNGTIIICSFICPQKKLRQMAKEIIGEQDFYEIFIQCSFEECKRRDVKGLYKKASAGNVKNFTGISSDFEEPDPEVPALIIDTENEYFDKSLEKLTKLINETI